MIRIVLRRLAGSVVGLLAVSLIIFWCVEWLPGDTASRILGQSATADALAALRERLHLNDPALARYWYWLRDAFSGDFGSSLVANRPVVDYVADRAANTLTLAAFALALYIPLSLFLGMLTAVKRDSAIDHVASVLVLVGMCVPEFVIGILLVVAFAVTLPWFPPLALIDQARSFGDLVGILFLPTITLTAAMTAYAVRMMRENLIDVLESDYVRMARLKGLSRRRVLLRHALPNALGPALNVTALNIAWLIGGIVVVESVFNFPGLGRLLIASIALKDFPVIQAVALLLTSVYILTNLAADLAVILLNPRLRSAQ